jgi:hypothetical protein
MNFPRKGTRKEISKRKKRDIPIKKEGNKEI